MAKPKAPQTLAKFIAYILERRPDEFGLFVDPLGWVKVKELIVVLNEEKGWKHVRRSHIDEVLYSLPNPPIEIIGKRIRARRRELLPQPKEIQDPPKLLFTCVRKRAYPVVLDKGISPTRYHQVVLSSNRNLAVRIGKRTGPEPVVLSVHVQKSIDEGVTFYQTGESLFITEFIPSGCFSGPPPPREKPGAKQPQPVAATGAPKAAGSFLVDADRVTDRRPAGGGMQKKRVNWKDGKKRIKKVKRKRERPPWRR